MTNVTRLLNAMAQGDAATAEELLPITVTRRSFLRASGSIFSFRFATRFIYLQLGDTEESGPEDRGNDWIIAHMLMREARALIEPDSTNAKIKTK